MQRDQSTGRFVKEDKQTTESGVSGAMLCYKSILALLVLCYPWLVIIFNNSAAILNMIKKFNGMIIDNIKHKEVDL